MGIVKVFARYELWVLVLASILFPTQDCFTKKRENQERPSPINGSQCDVLAWFTKQQFGGQTQACNNELSIHGIVGCYICKRLVKEQVKIIR